MAEIIRELLPERRCFVTLHGKPWVTVLPAPSEEDALAYSILELGTRVSPACRCPAIGFQVTDSDLFSWWVFSDNGEIVAQSCADPDKGSLSLEEEIGLAGDVAQIAALGADRGVTAEQVLDVLRMGRPGILEATLNGIGNLLGIEYARIGLSRCSGPNSKTEAL